MANKIISYKNYYPVELLKDLTLYTIPYGSESLIYDTIQSKCRHKLNKDGFGNLYVNIGDSKILFTAHMDTYSSKVEKVNHIIEDNKLKTDGRTILGGDNKVGCAILINMINNNIPGNYFFFMGEEVGRLGSEYYNSKIKEGKYNLAITFDRKEVGSVCSHQRGIKLSNDDLTNFIISELSNKTGYTFFEDLFGLSCDTYSFNEKVNNCLNISTGVYNEHKNNEYVDIDFYTAIFEASVKLNWKKIEELSDVKVREKINISNSSAESKEVLDILNYFIQNGYNPTKVPKYNEQFGIYTSNLYYKITPKIFDYFYVTISTDNKVIIDGIKLDKEDVMDYIQCYKELLIEMKFKSDKYHIVDFSQFNVTLLKNNTQKIDVELDDNFNFIVKSNLDESVLYWIKNTIENSGILNFFV